MSRLAQSMRLYMDSWTLHAERATDSGYVTATLDLTKGIGNHEGKFVVGDHWKSTAQWRRWASKELRGTILCANLRVGDLSWGIRGTWVLDEIDLNEHVYWAGLELKFGTISAADADECNDIGCLSETDRLTVHNGVLSAMAMQPVQTIDLNKRLGNSNGRFDTDGRNFSMSSKDTFVSGTILSGQLRQINGNWAQDQIDLRDLVQWRNGTLQFSTQKIVAQPVVPLDCNYCRPMFRHGRFFLPINEAPISLKPPLGASACPMCHLLRLIVRKECNSEDNFTELILMPSFYKSYRQAVVEVRYNIESSTNVFVPVANRYVIYNRAANLSKTSRTFHAVPRSPLHDAFFEPDRRWARVHGWIMNCSQNHDGECQKEAWPALPARVLDLESVNQGVVRVKVTNGECERYACASYRWGVEAPITLTTGNAEECEKNGISLNILPRTIVDVVHVCVNLGLRYLWVDSLCIHQDSERDWQVESLKMASYYGNCFISIAATSSPTSAAGWRLRSRPCAVKLTGSGPDGSPFRLLAYPLKEVEAFDEQKHFTQLSEIDLAKSFQLLKRGWVYQERRLAARVLHLCEHEVIFECATDTICECGHSKSYQMNWTKSLPEPPLRLYNVMNDTPEPEGPTDRTLAHAWRSACAAYSTLDLTFAHDKLPAISGLAKSMQSLGRYLAGVWENHLPADLCWYVGPDLVLDDPRITRQISIRETERQLAVHRRPEIYIAPSWSWASAQEPVSFLPSSSPLEPTTYTKLLNSVVVPHSNDPMGRVTAGSHLKLKAKLIETAWTCSLEGEATDHWYKLCDVKGMQGQFTLYGFLGRSKNNLVAPGDADDFNPEPVRFLPDYGLATSTSNTITTDKHLHVMPLQSETAFLHVSRLKHEINRALVVIGLNGAEYAPSNYARISALVLRRVFEHDLEKKNSLPVFERVGFTWFFARKPLAIESSAHEETDLILV
ncbi:uncharacterized protein PV09_02544 [Verruconis gallopava]|uniref:Cyanovirin-N domain-containing protein n=1 Tax=Verruconis gallopava TaxID=253628 RepID=A0A0D2AIY2_9PEZI|nr:uncharacterized protein PV09_02544 [Verruconis gallopava]KIW06868.1 hypothetical protein PV09_02544 [Verruconis gallopava]